MQSPGTPHPYLPSNPPGKKRGGGANGGAKELSGSVASRGRMAARGRPGPAGTPVITAAQHRPQPQALRVHLEVGGRKVPALLDTGASVSLIEEDEVSGKITETASWGF